MRVFYSWQSDLDSKYARYLIESAVEDACKQLQKKHGEEFYMDQATRGKPGSPSIPETILEKIDQCDVFVCDVSLVDTPGANSFRTPNPNVLLELGYAAKAVGWQRVLCTINTSFGQIDELPFDLKTRRMHPFSCSKNDEVKLSRQELSRFFFSAIEAIHQYGRLKVLLDLNFYDKESGASIGKKAVAESTSYSSITKEDVLSGLSLEDFGIEDVPSSSRSSFSLQQSRWRYDENGSDWKIHLITEKIAAVERQERLDSHGIVAMMPFNDTTTNPKYFEEFITYQCILKRLVPLTFELSNDSDGPLQNVKLQFSFPKAGDVEVLTFDELPRTPRESTLSFLSNSSVRSTGYVSEEFRSEKQLTMHVPLVRPREHISTGEPVYLLPNKTLNYAFLVDVFSQDESPHRFSFDVQITVLAKELTPRDVLKFPGT